MVPREEMTAITRDLRSELGFLCDLFPVTKWRNFRFCKENDVFRMRFVSFEQFQMGLEIIYYSRTICWTQLSSKQILIPIVGVIFRQIPIVPE